MRCFSFILLALLLITGVACTNKPKYDPDPSLTQKRAERGYSELDQEVTKTYPTSKNTSQGNFTQESSNPPPTLMVMPAKNASNQSELAVVNDTPMSKAMMEAINGYLTQKRYEVKSLEGQAQLDNIVKMQNDIANTDDDLSYLASLALGADIYVKFSGSVQPNNVVVEVNAYETSTGRLLGSQTAEVKNNGHTDQVNLRANVQSAARKAMPNLEQKILAYWNMDLSKGVQYKVVMNLKGEYTDNQIEDLQDFAIKALKNTFNSVTVNVMTDKTIDVVVYADPQKYRDSQEVYSQIRTLLKSITDSKKINITKKLILMDLN